MKTKFIALIITLGLMCVLSSCSPSYAVKGDITTLKSLSSIQHSNQASQSQKTKPLSNRYNVAQNNINYIYYSLCFVAILILNMIIFRKRLKIIVFGKEKVL